MALAKLFANAAGEAASATTIVSASFDSTGYTHLVAFIKNESGAATLTMSDNKSSGTWTSLTQATSPGTSSAAQLFWVKIGSPGSGHTVTGTFSAARDWRTLVVWLVDADTGEIELDDETTGSGTGTAVDAGSLDTTGASVVSFMGGAETDGVDWTESSGWTEDADNPGDTASFAASRGPETTTPIDPAATASASMEWAAVAASFRELASGTVEQEGFAFGDDDNNEASHTLDSEDTNATEDLGTAKTIRFLLQATDDPSSAAYTLRAQKNGSGGYTAVGVGSSYKIQPVIEAADVTQSGNNTASTSWAVSVPALATGDLCIIHIGWDDSTDTTDVSEPAGPDSETINEVIATPITDAGTTIRAKAWWFVATNTYAGGTLTFTPSASEQWSAHVVKVPAGEFDSGDPIGEADDVAGGSDSEVDSPAFSAGASDGTGTLIWFATVNADPLLTVGSGWTELDKQDIGAVASGVAVRDAAVTDSESIASAIWAITADTWASIALIVRAPTITPEIFIAPSANVTAGGEATTNRLTGGTGSFVTGRRWDNENGSDSIDLTTDNFTEVEWVLDTQSPAAGGNYWDLRVYAGSSAIDTYTVTPRLTLNGGAASVGLFMSHYIRLHNAS